jgi:hypothetical protein
MESEMELATLKGKSADELIAIIMQQKANAQRKLSCKVSDKGAVSVYGLGKWPVTLYASQWEAFLPFIKSGAVEQFMEANKALLSHKA